MPLRTRWPVASLVITAVLAAIASVAFAAPSSQSNLAAARADAARTLALIQLPPDAVASPTEPAGDRGDLGLALPPAVGAHLNLVDAHAWWTLSESPAQVMAYVNARLPPSARPTGSSSNDAPFVSDYESFALPPIAHVLSLRALGIVAMRLTPTTTAVRADGQAIWLVSRPAWDRVRAGVRSVTFTARYPVAPGGGSARSAPRTISGAAARRLIALIDRLEVDQPGGLAACRVSNGAVSVRLAFQGPSGRVLDQAVEGVAQGLEHCGVIRLTAHGRTGPALVDDPSLTVELERLDVIPVCRAAQLRASASLLRSRGFDSNAGITITNTSRSVCRLAGFPRVSLLARPGRALRTEDTDVDRHAVERAGLQGAVQLYPGTGTTINLSFGLCARRRYGVRVVLPGESHAFPLRVGSRARPFTACTALSVSSVSPWL